MTVQLRTPIAAKPVQTPGSELAEEAKAWIREVTRRNMVRRDNDWLYPYGLNYNGCIDWTGHPGKAPNHNTTN